MIDLYFSGGFHPSHDGHPWRADARKGSMRFARRLIRSTLALGFMVAGLPLAMADTQNYYQQHIQPIFNGRCVQCHSCYNAPCQLNLTSTEGLNRGMVKDFDVYNSKRIRAEEPSRLGIDRKSPAEWQNFSRDHRFRPVTGKDPLLLTLVEHKAAHAGLAVDDLNDTKNQQAENSRVCPDNSRDLAKHLKSRPSAGMPYGLPPLNEEELAAIREWHAQGAPRPEMDKSIPKEELAEARRVEAFFNAFTSGPEAQAKKQSLVSRYLYEHLFLAHIYLKPDGKNFYRLVRSRNACEAGVNEIATRRPWNDTEEKFFYCLQRLDETLMHKTHIVYSVDEQKLARWHELFLKPEWNVTWAKQQWSLSRLWSTPKGWPVDVAPRSDEEGSNPLLVFRDMPVRSRYQFLLDDAQYQVMTFIRGPVCKGNTAVNSIDEQFYVFFLDPNSDLMVRNEEFARAAIPLHLLPAHKGSEQVGGVIVGRKIRETREKYRALRDTYYGKEFPQGYGTEDIWRGNANAGLTVFRHYDSSAVVKGLVGATSKTAYVLDYSLLERLVYVLVTGFDVYGDVGHQLHTRLYMSYIRMEAEENFLSLLPPSVREPMRKSWYIESNGVTEKIGRAVNTVLLRDKDKIGRKFPLLGLEKPTRVSLPALDQNAFYGYDGNGQETVLRKYRRALVKQLKDRLGEVLVANGSVDLNPDKALTSGGAAIGEVSNAREFEEEFAKLTDVKGMNAPWVLHMPSLAYVLVEGAGGPEIYTVVRNKEHFNIAWIFGETGRRNHAADSITLYKGVMGSYPNHFFVIKANQGRKFLQKMREIHDDASYDAWIQEFGNPRDSVKFWANSDRLHQVFKQKYPVEYGAFDYNRYGVDYRFHKDGDEADALNSDLSTDLTDMIKDSSEEK